MLIRIADEIYVSYAEITMGSQVSYVLPQSFVTIIDYDLDGMSDEVLEHKVLYRAKNLKELREKFDKDQDLFYAMLKEVRSGNTPSVIIYADPDGFLDLLFSWWKTIMPDLTFKGARALWSSYKDMETLQVARLWTWVDITNDSAALPFSAIEERYWKHTAAYLKKKFKKATPFEGLGEDILYSCPIEFMLMGYLSDSLSDKAKTILDYRLEAWAKKAASLEFTKLRKSIEQDLNTLWRVFPELKKYSLLDSKSLKDGLMSLEETSWLIDPKITDDDAGFNYILSTRDVRKFFTLLTGISTELHHYPGSGRESEIGLYDSPMIWFLGKHGGLPTAKDLLDGEMLEGRNSFPGKLDDWEIFREDVRQKAVNPHIVSAFDLLFKANPKDAKEFKLV